MTLKARGRDSHYTGAKTPVTLSILSSSSRNTTACILWTSRSRTPLVVPGSVLRATGGCLQLSLGPWQGPGYSFVYSEVVCTEVWHPQKFQKQNPHGCQDKTYTVYTIDGQILAPCCTSRVCAQRARIVTKTPQSSSSLCGRVGDGGGGQLFAFHGLMPPSAA